eukprot:534984_1
MIISSIFIFIYSLSFLYRLIQRHFTMATAATIHPRDHASIRAPIPSNYFCKSCGLEAHHWIMDCSLLAIFHAANNLLSINAITSKEDKQKKQDLSDTLVQIRCANHSIAECQSLYRITMMLRFYQENANDDKALVQYLSRYCHLLDDYTHIVSDHLDQDKDTNDLNAAMIYTTVSQYIQCDITKCPHFIREHEVQTSATEDKQTTFYKNTLDTIHCYFLHPFHTGFKMIKTRSFVEKHCKKKANPKPSVDDDDWKAISPSLGADTHENDDETLVTWDDEELTHLQSELNVRRHLLRTRRGIEYNKFNKFMITIPQQMSADTSHYFGERFYYWEWYNNNTRQDWRCNPGRSYSALYIKPKYKDIKQEMTHNKIFKVTATDFEGIRVKAHHYLNSSQVIRRVKSCGNELCHYGVNDGTPLQLHHLIAVILHTDYRELSYYFVNTFRKWNGMENVSRTDKALKARKREYHFWSKYLRETVELYGTPVTESKIDIFYVTLSNPVMFDSFQTRFCLPTSTTSQLQIVTMSTQNGLILELKSPADSVQFYHGLLKYFNCSLISRFGEEDERLFIGGYAPLQFHNIRILIERKENYHVFIQAIKCFNAVLDGEESDDFDYNAAYRGATASYMSRMDTRSYESSYSQCTMSRIDTSEFIMDTMADPPQIKRRPTIVFDKDDDVEKCSKIDAIVIDKLCKAIVNAEYLNGYPSYVNDMFKHMVQRRESAFINLHDLKTNFKPFCHVLLSPECDALIRFDVLSAVLMKCRVIAVDMNQYESLDSNYLLALCEQMIAIAQNENSNLEMIVLVKAQGITLDVWGQIHDKCKQYDGHFWFQCLTQSRYHPEKDLKLFFDDEAYQKYLHSQQENSNDDSYNLYQNQNDEEYWAIDAPKSHRL